MGHPNYGSSHLLAGSPVRETQSDCKEYADLKTLTGSVWRSLSDRSCGSGAPMKVLIAEEMTKEGDTNQKTTSVVARLMGLDDVALPKLVQHSNMRRFPDGHLSSTLARINSQMSFDKHTGFVENVEYKDVYEVGYQPLSSEHLSNEFPQRRRLHEDHDKKRMDLVRQKFVEAKQLASHENLLQSKQFNDALEVLNSNKDLFLKFLEEPNSLFGKQTGEFHYAPASPQTKRITVLKPTRSVEIKGEKAIKRHQDQTVNGTRVERSNIHRKPNSCHAKAERPPQHTRIVVLKPTLAITSVGHFQKNGHDDLDDSEAPVISRHSSDEIDWSLQDMCHQHDESFRGCMLPNMFPKDRAHYEYAEEDGSSFSDSEVGSPTSRHSWDYIYRIGNPYFGSSLSHASCSPESLVTREAKKHTSDRWPIVSSNEVSQEKVLVRRSLSTLGDLLAMSDMKTKEASEQVVTGTSNQLCSNEPRLVVQSKCYIDGENRESSLKKISRSKSVPVSSAAFDSLRLDAGCSNPQDEEPTLPKEEIKPKNGKSSLKGKISSFFLKHKKAGKDKLAPSPLGALGSRVPLANNESIVNSDVSQPECTSLQDNVASENLEKLGIAPTVVPGNEPKATSSSSKSPISLEKALLFEIRNSHLDQPSPTSVLAASFEEPPNSSESAIVTKQEPLSRSLPIGSIARTLSWDDSSQEATLCSSKGDNHEQEQHEFIEKILSSAGFGDEKTSDIFVRWHTLDFPLGTALYDQFLERKVEDAKGRERRSNQRLLIDSVSAALLDIGQSKLWGAYPCTEPQSVATGDVLVVDEVWRLVKGWLSDDDGEEHMVNAIDNVGLAADWVVGREIQGRAWPETRRLEVDEISKEICGEIMAELVGEAFSGLA
ncbi:hypothetical protein GUJ93_ZPchr0006g42717 [Zizania palustris]|uniref:DUF4378 domain-containing protein n=1 Tax=Zizania palustris TaxID=103762 RepID=A0A8J5T488_ZIZPA|nr:hypothetical protein GUJ93_ZPchr0006g42717 [Zizania palustris]KAG8073433.1 hypothetical protein GUJ93_ZPchr0006g42717 [Zizania palustris]